VLPAYPPTAVVSTTESVDLAFEIFNRVFRRVPGFGVVS